MNVDDSTRLHHMLQAARIALEFAQDASRETLNTDRKLVFALVRAVEIIGEAAGRISKAFQTSHPQIPWPAIIGMRNRLVHGYFDVDLDQVWSTIANDLPVLISELEKLIPPETN